MEHLAKLRMREFFRPLDDRLRMDYLNNKTSQLYKNPEHGRKLTQKDKIIQAYKDIFSMKEGVGGYFLSALRGRLKVTSKFR